MRGMTIFWKKQIVIKSVSPPKTFRKMCFPPFICCSEKNHYSPPTTDQCEKRWCPPPDCPSDLVVNFGHSLRASQITHVRKNLPFFKWDNNWSLLQHLFIQLLFLKKLGYHLPSSKLGQPLDYKIIFYLRMSIESSFRLNTVFTLFSACYLLMHSCVILSRYTCS